MFEWIEELMEASGCDWDTPLGNTTQCLTITTNQKITNRRKRNDKERDFNQVNRN